MNVTRLLNLALIAALIAGVVMTYQTKLRTESAAEEVAKLQREIDREEGEIALLRAELSMLTQPGRLQEVVEQHSDYFRLVPFAADKLGSIDEIPLREGGTDDDARETLARLAAGEVR